MRDIDNDARTGKMTLVVKMGTANAKRYHFTLLSTAMILPCLYTIFNWQSAFQFLFLLSFPFIVRNVWHVFKNENARDLDPELKRLAISTLLFSLSFGLGLVL